MSTKGVYFVANDVVYDLVVAFLKSFRIHNPALNLCLIPFDDKTSRLAALAEQYNFTCFTDDALFSRCDEISRRIHGVTKGTYRKLAAWHGPFDEFIYIDTDTVVTASVAFVYEFLDDHDFVFSQSDYPELRYWVWKETIYSTGALTRAQIDFSASTGFICSKKGMMSVDEAEKKLADALAIVDHMELFCMEQPFLNYVIVTSGKRYSSISNIAAETRAPYLPVEKWGGERLRVLSMENCRTSTHNVMMVHWAGVWRQWAIEKWFYRQVRKLGYKGSLPTVNSFMRNRRLWRYYRYQPEHLFSQRYRRGQ
jgi:hypothetical protein